LRTARPRERSRTPLTLYMYNESAAPTVTYSHTARSLPDDALSFDSDGVGQQGGVLVPMCPSWPPGGRTKWLSVNCHRPFLSSPTAGLCAPVARSRPLALAAVSLPMTVSSLPSHHEALATAPTGRHSGLVGAYPARLVLALSLPASVCGATSSSLRCLARASPLSACTAPCPPSPCITPSSWVIHVCHIHVVLCYTQREVLVSVIVRTSIAISQAS